MLNNVRDASGLYSKTLFFSFPSAPEPKLGLAYMTLYASDFPLWGNHHAPSGLCA